jgi:hypothetical protein
LLPGAKRSPLVSALISSGGEELLVRKGREGRKEERMHDCARGRRFCGPERPMTVFDQNLSSASFAPFASFADKFASPDKVKP